jgi:starch synthase
MVSESGAQGPRPSLARRYCIVFCASEAAPFAKTGGLGDVVGALPKVLSRMGHDVSVFCPLYRTVRSSAQLEDTRVRAKVPILNRLFEAEIWRSTLPGSEVPVYFVRNDEYYDRPGF